MILILLLAVIGHAATVPLTSQVAVPTTEELSARYVLPQEVRPTLYDVELELNPENPDFFVGNVSIRVIAYTDATYITLHAMEMSIHRISVLDSANNNLFANFTLASDDTHLLRIALTEPLRTFQFYFIEVDYVGTYAENMFGVYVSTYEYEGVTARLITSQLQPTFARRAFPCFDEPALKATFRTTIYAPASYPVVRSNTPEKAVTTKNDRPGLVTHEFEDTLIMSTYLLAYLVSNFEYIDNSENPIYDKPFRVYSRPGTRQFAEFALDFGQQNLIALENYTEMTYAFPKMDKAAVPDFAAGAMENWGLVIYREVALLVQEGVTTTSVKQNIGRIICHENTHMWFGNEVGPDSWTYTWLNEGFANFFENFGTDLVLPGWRMMDQFVILLQNVFQNDAVISVNPMTHPVFTPSQILGTFNAVAYQKSGSVIRMMKHFLTPEVFRRGLAIYLRNRSRQAATPTHLYEGLQAALAASNHSIPYSLTAIMTRWTTQGGFPVLTVRKSAPSANSISVEQERFLTDNSLSSDDRWHVPINWVLSSSPNFEDTSPQAWVPPSLPAQSYNIPNLAEAEWFIINKQQTGYYRVNYEPSNWAALATALDANHQLIHVLNRAQLIDDSFNMARNSRLSYQYAFELSRYLAKEEDYIPWASANNAYSYLDIVLSGSGETYRLFQSYVLNLTASSYERLGFIPNQNDEHVTAFHRNIILDLSCRYGFEDCVSTAQGLLQQFRTNPSQRPAADIQTTVFCSGLRGGDADNFNFLWGLYEASNDSSEESILLNALGCTSNEELRTFYLNQVISNNSIVRDQDRHTVIVSTINASPENMEAALDFVIEHFAEIQPRVQGLTGTTNILNAFARRLTTEAHLGKIGDFESRHASIFTAGELAAIAAIRENIAASITWSNNNFGAVNAWLNQNYGNSANIITGSFILLFSIIITIINN